MEEKKKTGTKKKTGAKRPAAKKTTQVKKAAPKKTTPAKVAAPKKKTQPKTSQAKKPAPKKIEKKVEVKEEVKKEVKPVEKESKLEKTIIFSGKEKKNLKEVVEKLEEETVVVEDKVIKRSKVNKILIIIIAILMVLITAASTAYVVSHQQIGKKPTQTTGSNIYEKAKENKIQPVENTEEEAEDVKEKYEHIVTISLAQFETKALNKDNMVVLVASSSCAQCAYYEKNVLEPLFAELNQKIYRLDIKEMEKDNVSRFRTYFAFTVTPTVFIVKDGVVVADTAKTGSMTKDELKAWLDKNN